MELSMFTDGIFYVYSSCYIHPNMDTYSSADDNVFISQ